MPARVLLALLAAAGLFYVNIMPALVDGLKQGLGYSNKQAGLVASFNVYGAACGALLIAFLARRSEWRSAARLMLLGMIAMDLLSSLIVNPFVLAGVRFAHGFIGGMLVGLAFSIIARTNAPDRTFGMLLLVQGLFGGLGVLCLPLLVLRFGAKVLFFTLVLCSLTVLLMMQFLPDYPIPAPTPGPQGKRSIGVKSMLLLLALLSVFLFQAANEGLYAFIIGLGRNHGLGLEFISETLGIANWCAIFGALLVVVISTRFGVFKPVIGAMLLTLAGTFAFNYCELKWLWIVANIGTGFTWNFVISHLLGMCARFDRTGQASLWSSFASKAGLASGPMLASFVVGVDNYLALIVMSLVLMAFATIASAKPAWILDHS